MLKEEDTSGHPRLRGPGSLGCAETGLTFNKGVCLAFRPFSLPILAGRQTWFNEGLSEPPLPVPCRLPESL